MSALDKLSGTVVYQRQTPENDDDFLTVGNSYLYQEFYLPNDYVRGSYVPTITGGCLFVNIEPDRAGTATLDWVFERYETGTGWVQLISGIQIGGVSDGEGVPFDIDFDFDLAETEVSDKFRLGVRGRSTSEDDLNVPVAYNYPTAVVKDVNVTARLEVDIPFPVTLEGVDGFLLLDDGGNVTYSTQRGITALWYSVPNPLAITGARATDANGDPIQDGSRDVSFLFHIHAAVADEGTDFLGNRYRSVVVRQKIENVSTTEGGVSNAFWLSKPNPSKFAVETLYFDLSKDGQSVVIDRLLIDPLTPDVWFSIYYSNEGEPGTTEFEWESKLWTRVPQTYQMKRRDTLALPNPITCRYVCIEFSHLLEKSYNPGDFQKQARYKKHPKWVLDYFLFRTAENTDNPYIASRVTVTYDALDLAFNYYLDDLQPSPDDPKALGITTDSNSLDQFLANRSDVAEHVDATTARKINTIFTYYQNHISVMGKDNFLMTAFSALSARDPGNPDNQTEGNIVNTFADTRDIDLARSQEIIFEKNYPVMFFFVDCRHVYREVVADFERDLAYFVGVRELAFFRDHYTTTADNSLYIEQGGDDLTAEVNDFAQVNGTLQVYDDTT